MSEVTTDFTDRLCYDKLAYVTEPIVEKLRQDAQALIASQQLEPPGVAEWAHKELLERIRMDPPDGIADLPEEDRHAIYCFVMGYISALRF